jgi:hypothetical protein
VGFNWQGVLDSWSVTWEQNKADFMEELYEFYCPTSYGYTGLFQLYEKDLAEFVRDYTRIPSEDPRHGKPWLFPAPTMS